MTFVHPFIHVQKLRVHGPQAITRAEYARPVAGCAAPPQKKHVMSLLSADRATSGRCGIGSSRRRACDTSRDGAPDHYGITAEGMFTVLVDEIELTPLSGEERRR